jgi:hypothetical protein
MNLNLTRKQLILGAAICGGLTALGCLLPWVTHEGFMGAGPNFSGLNTTYGWIVFLAAIVAGAAALLLHLGKVGQFVKITEIQHVYVAIGCFGLASLICLVQMTSSVYQTASVAGYTIGAGRGLGLWISLLGAIGGEAASFLAMRAAAGAPGTKAPGA